MKYFLFLCLFTFTNLSFSQSEANSQTEKNEEVNKYANPSQSNNLSRYFRNRISNSLLDAYKINDSIESKNTVYLTFKFSKENKVTSISVNSPYSELNKNIKDAFTDYDIKNLDIPEKSPLNIYVLQILSKVGNKMVVNCSTNIVYERYPVFEGCESQTSYSNMKSCINKQLEAHIAMNISPVVIKKAKVLGSLNLNPKFIINEKGAIELIQPKSATDSLAIELNRVLSLFPNAKTPALRNSKPMRMLFKSTVHLQIDSENKEYIDDVIKSKDSTLNPNNELAQHFKNFISEDELKKLIFPLNSKKIRIHFSLDKKGNMINIKSNSPNKIMNNRLVSLFNNFPVEKLNIQSSTALESYYYTIITKEYPVNIIQCNDKPDVYIPPHYGKNCSKLNSPDELVKCLQENIAGYIVHNFDTKLRSKTKLTGDIRMYCSFQVAENAMITNVKVQAPNPILANDIEQIMKSVPNANKPAYLNGVAIKSSYTIPIVFKLGDNIPVDPYKDINKTFNRK